MIDPPVDARSFALAAFGCRGLRIARRPHGDGNALEVYLPEGVGDDEARAMIEHLRRERVFVVGYVRKLDEALAFIEGYLDRFPLGDYLTALVRTSAIRMRQTLLWSLVEYAARLPELAREGGCANRVGESARDEASQPTVEAQRSAREDDRRAS